MNNILVVNVNWLGDAVFSSAVFKALKNNFPAALIRRMWQRPLGSFGLMLSMFQAGWKGIVIVIV